MNDYVKISENIISWYNFEKNSKLLLFSIEDEEYLNNYFVKNDIRLTKYHLKKNNICEKMKNIIFDDKFDYVLLLGSYEYSPLFLESVEPYVDLLKYLKNLLNENGKIIFTIDNKFGVKYFAGAKSEHYSKIFGGFLNNVDYQKSNLLSKQEILKTIEKAGFKNYKFYYPVPNYCRTNAIFTDNFLPTESTSKILYKLYYNPNSIVLYNEIELLKQFCKEGLFTEFCNSYLVELSLKSDINNVKFVSYNTLRKGKYDLKLVIDDNVVIKTPVSIEAKEHIENIRNYIEKLRELGFNILDYIENDVLKSNFVEYEELDRLLVKLISSNNIEEAYLQIENWYKYLKDRLLVDEIFDFRRENIFKHFNIEVDEENLAKMNFIKNGFIDLAFENTFIDVNNNYLFYDQEWFFKNIPIEFILYRALNNLYCYNENQIKGKISLDEMMEHFGLLNFRIYFEKIEEIIQNEILDNKKVLENNEDVVKFYYLEELIRDNQNLSQDNKKLLQDNNAWRKKYEILEKKYDSLEKEYMHMIEKYNELGNKYSAIVDSRLYKIMKSLKGDKND